VGNHTQMRIRSGAVVAANDWADEGDPTEEISVEEFLTLLAEWRELVVRIRSARWYRVRAAVARFRMIGGS
jgi:hypothetical protein